MMGKQFDQFKRDFNTVDGFFMEEAQALWDFLLCKQAKMNVRGDFIEIGVYKGKSAILGALYLREDEAAILVDIHDPVQAEEMIQSLNGPKVDKFVGRSIDFPKSSVFKKVDCVRWFHIDGDHSGFSTTTDLETAASIISPRGLLCVDDFFNPRYPQLTAAVYRFLFDRTTFQLLLCGANKAFICHKADYAMYEKLIRESLSDHLKELNISVTLSKSSYAHDFGCFAIGRRNRDRDILGRDEDWDDIVF